MLKFFVWLLVINTFGPWALLLAGLLVLIVWSVLKAIVLAVRDTALRAVYHPAIVVEPPPTAPPSVRHPPPAPVALKAPVDRAPVGAPPSQTAPPQDHWDTGESSEPMVRQQTATGEWVWRYPPRRPIRSKK